MKATALGIEILATQRIPAVILAILFVETPSNDDGLPVSCSNQGIPVDTAPVVGSMVVLPYPQFATNRCDESADYRSRVPSRRDDGILSTAIYRKWKQAFGPLLARFTKGSARPAPLLAGARSGGRTWHGFRAYVRAHDFERDSNA